MARQTGKRPKALDGPPFPTELAHVWKWFCEISLGRGHNGFGPSRLSHLDFLAYRLNYRLQMEPWEIRALTLLDSAWIAAQHDSKPPKPDPETPPTKPAKRKKA